MRRLLTVAALAAGLFAAATPFDKDEADFRAARENSLRAPGGWLAVAGLFWLREGTTTAGSDPKSDIVLPAGAARHVGNFTLHKNTVTFEPAKGASVLFNGKPATRTTVKPDSDDHPDVITSGRFTLTAIQRIDKTGIRMRDPEAASRRNFTGCAWFPVSRKWRIEAKWVPYPTPKKIRITNILGMTDEEDSPGYAEFSLNGKTVRLEPVKDGDELAFMFRDTTSGKSTYAPGRFLDTWMPKNGIVIIDFNEAYNPPCAFTAFATCPLPPRQNNLPLAVEAGEKKYAGSH